MHRMKCLRPIAPLLAAGLFLGGCDWFGESDAPPLPGTRIAVMVVDSDAEPDPRLADLRVKLPAPYTNDAWPQGGGYPDHAMHHLEANELLREAWRVSIGSGSDGDRRLLSGPVVAENRVYTMDSDFEIRAFDAVTGKRIWSFEPEIPDEDDEAFGGGIAYADRMIFVTTGYARVFALNAETGQLIWNQKAPGPIRAAPSIGEGKVLAISIDNRVTAYNADTGEEIWFHAGFAETAGLLGGASAAVSERTAVVPYSSGEIYSLRLSTGRANWSDSLVSVRRIDALASLADIRGRPIVDRGVVYAISHGGRMVALDLASGSRAWDRRIGGTQTPWIAGEFLYVITSDQTVLCMTRRGGRVRWATPLPNFEDPEDLEDPITWSGPVLVSDRLLIGNSMGELWSISPYDGKPLGRIDLGDPIYVPPIVANGTVYVQTDDGVLIALR
ncbi:MAG: PQQ-binding-like beta-propeller repeat protein [Alphaproteobacteria bacterium]|nr:PQQ-binding-like beta-propeller repeat protein [Alphaproteobacteria bacterium]MBO6862677.1 PQQ-binding-like beta-propeller repeat protein [Alphaproteobacteria bacterium]